MTLTEGIASGVTLLTFFGGLFAYALKVARESTATMVSIKTAIENNTAVIERITDKLDQHDDTFKEHAEILGEHGERIVAMETKHRVRHGGE